MRTLWIGLQADDVLCGHELGRETIERMREHGHLVRFGTSAFQAIYRDGKAIGYGLVIARKTRDIPFTLDTEPIQPFFERVRRAFGMRGIGGRFTLNMEETDPPRLPARVVS